MHSAEFSRADELLRKRIRLLEGRVKELERILDRFEKPTPSRDAIELLSFGDPTVVVPLREPPRPAA